MEEWLHLVERPQAHPVPRVVDVQRFAQGGQVLAPAGAGRAGPFVGRVELSGELAFGCNLDELERPIVLR